MRHAVVRSERGKVGRGSETMEAVCQNIQNKGGWAMCLRRVLMHRLHENLWLRATDRNSHCHLPAYASDKQQTNLQKKTAQTVQTELSQKVQKRADLSRSTLPQTNPTELPVIPSQITHSERPIKDLLQDTKFKEEACRLLGIGEVPEFSAQELDGAYEVAREIKQRLKALVEDPNRLTLAQRTSKVWGWAEKNCVRMLALKILSGYVDLTKGSGTGCFLKGKQVFELVPTKTKKTEIFGSYLVWDEEIGTWIRSGKSKDCTKRTLTHNKDAQDYRGSTTEIKKKTYLEFIEKNASRWDKLSFHLSTSFTIQGDNRGHLPEAARFMVYPTEVINWLRKLKSGAPKKWHELEVPNESPYAIDRRKQTLFAYLSESVDDLLLDRAATKGSSYSAGFENFLARKWN